MFFLLFFIALGCESEPKGPKTLDWNKTASEQKIEVGDTIVVEGITNNIVDYRDLEGSAHGTSDVISFSVPMSYRESWDDEISIPMFNPEQPGVTENPNVPIGIVICKIYNPAYNKELQAVYETYPKVVVQETRLDAARMVFDNLYPHENYRFSPSDGKYIHPLFLHRFRFTGTIHRIGRQKVEHVSVHSLDIEVSDVVVIGSEQVIKIEDWRTDSNLRFHTINVDAFVIEIKEKLESIQKEIAEKERLLKEQEK